jgi:hypothetical protein
MAVLVGGCGTAVQTLSFPEPPSTTASSAPSAPTLPSDLSAIGQLPVPGATTTTVPAIGPGQATLNGTVTGPDGPVSGATVEVDRLVGDQVSTIDTTTAADGSWTVAGILGGRFRVRAWQSPSLDLTTPQLLYLGATQSESLSLQLNQYKGPNVVAGISPATPILGEPTNLLVQVTNPTVGTNGVLTYPPDTSAVVTLSGGSDWQLDSADLTVITDIAGNALFQVTCTALGSDPLFAQVGSAAPVALSLPACAPPPTTTIPTTTTTLLPCPSTTTSTESPGGATTLPDGTC